MISEGRGLMRQAWWISTFPGLAMFVTVMGFNLLGDGLRDVFDPKMRR
jgi:peptide/nickel transport system permease protein